MSLPTRIQRGLSEYYGIEDVPSVVDFIAPSDEAREVLLVRHHGEELEVLLHLPKSAVEPNAVPSFDELCQIVEGVSHFLCVAERARRELPVTQLELELQAEVDKYLVFAHPGVFQKPFEPERAARIREKLYGRVLYLDPVGTEPGDRYRMANDLAARFAQRLEAIFAKRGRFGEMRAALRRFFDAGQTEKLELARAA